MDRSELEKEFRETFEGEIDKVRIIRELRKNHNLRKVIGYLMISKEPEKVGEIKDNSVFVQNSTMYGYLDKLVKWGFLEVIPIPDIWNKTKLTPNQKKALKKFKGWTSTMSESQRANWFKTKYWVITDKVESFRQTIMDLEKDSQQDHVGGL